MLFIRLYFCLLIQIVLNSISNDHKIKSDFFKLRESVLQNLFVVILILKLVVLFKVVLNIKYILFTELIMRFDFQIINSLLVNIVQNVLSLLGKHVIFWFEYLWLLVETGLNFIEYMGVEDDFELVEMKNFGYMKQ